MSSTQSRLHLLLSYIERDAGNLTLRKDAIREACDTGRWDIAQDLVESGLQNNPGEPGLMGWAGVAHLQQQRYEEAEQALAAALAQGLDTPELHYNLAFATFMQKRYAEALEHLAAPLLPLALPLALLLRARCLHHLGRQAEAIGNCRDYLASSWEDAEAHGLLALLLYEEGQSAAAAEHVQAALTRNPRQLEALLAQASLQSDVHDYDTSRRCFETLLQAHPQCGRGWLGLALIDLNQMRVDTARRSIELAAMYMPEHVGTWHVLAWLQLLSGDVPAARQAFERALASDRNFAESHGGLAVVAALEGRDDEAALSIKRALRLDPEAMSPQYARLLLLQHEGREQEAQAVLDQFLARPVPRGDMRYRDLVDAHRQYLRSLAEPPQGSTVH